VFDALIADGSFVPCRVAKGTAHYDGYARLAEHFDHVENMRRIDERARQEREEHERRCAEYAKPIESNTAQPTAPTADNAGIQGDGFLEGLTDAIYKISDL
jgi:hypothetical protein